MPVIVLLILAFVIISLIGKALNILKLGLIIGIIFLILSPLILTNFSISQDKIKGFDESRFELIQTEDVSTFKIRPKFKEGNILTTSVSEIFEGPEKVYIYYNQENMENIPNEMKNLIESIYKN